VADGVDEHGWSLFVDAVSRRDSLRLGGQRRAAALLDLECVVYMGSDDIVCQTANVDRMSLLGAVVRPVDAGSRTLKNAINEVIRDGVNHVDWTYYLLGSALGPHPYPSNVRSFQTVVGREARPQVLETVGRLPDLLVTCVGGGSNAIGGQAENGLCPLDRLRLHRVSHRHDRAEGWDPRWTSRVRRERSCLDRQADCRRIWDRDAGSCDRSGADR